MSLLVDVIVEQIRAVLAAAALVVYGPGLLFWFVVHPFIRFWRKLGSLLTYFIVGTALAVIGFGVFQTRAILVGRNLGTNWRLILFGMALWVILGFVGLASGKDHLDVATRMGLQELSRETRPRALLRDGLYGIVRHPIYLFAILYGLAYALIVNYTGTYLLFAAAGPVLYAITVLEERELVERFGEAYRQYQRDVPRLCPFIRRRNS